MNFIAAAWWVLCRAMLRVCGPAAWFWLTLLSSGSIVQLKPAGAFCSICVST